MDGIIDTILLLQSFFSLPGEFELLSIPAPLVARLSNCGIWDAEELERFVDATSSVVSVKVKVDLREDGGYPIDLRIGIPVSSSKTPSDEDAGHETKVHLIQPDYLPRQIHDEWQSQLDQLPPSATPTDTILAAIDHLRILGSSYILETSRIEEAADFCEVTTEDKLERVWFWFPSLSTKEKRRDLVEYGRERGLTGFVLAGKPGLLCVEGRGELIDKYMSAIKSESWSDIPSYQKKVTERHRQSIHQRSFPSMQEITDEITHGGYRGNKTDMKDVEVYMEKMGVGDVFGIVVGGGFG